MLDNIIIRQLTTMAQMKSVEQVEKKVWNMSPLPLHQTFTAINNGGIILGAYHENKMVGFLYSFPGFDGKEIYLCSHMLGILPKYRTGGLGMQMKFEQAKIAIEKGYSKITWTYDPLESLNAYLNLHKLGAVGAYYKANHYGNMDDKLNKGLPTDRIQIEWDIDSVKDKPQTSLGIIEEKVLLKARNNMEPILTDIYQKNDSFENGPWFVAIPDNFQEIKVKNNELAKKWRLKSSEVFQVLFSMGFKATDLIRVPSNHASYYCFKKLPVL